MANADLIWRAMCPAKIKIFMLLLEKDTILTYPMLVKHCWQGLKICVLCLTDRKDSSYLFPGCLYYCKIWSACANRFGGQI